jgi:tRNA1(Val) A37 N6-methylase TrmN6
MLLADFVRLPRNANVLDLGAGCGTLGLLLCASDASCHITGIELDAAAHRAASDNICRNSLSDRMESIFGDLRRLPDTVKAGSFSCCVSNPPYFSSGVLSHSMPLARHTGACETADLFTAAAHALKYGGDFFLVHKPEMLAQLCAHAVMNALEPKRLCLVRHSPGKDISTVLLQFRKGGKPGLKLEEYCLYDENGQPTPAYRRIYHLGD